MSEHAGEIQVDPRTVVGAKVALWCPDCGQQVVTEVVAVDVWPETIARPAMTAPIVAWRDRRRWVRVEDLSLLEETPGETE